MEYGCIFLLMCVVLILLRWIIGTKVKEIKQLADNEKLNELTDRLPENTEVAKEILKQLHHENVKIKEDSQGESSFYFVMTNTISIANIRKSYTRIQTIAHECIHSIQDKKLLWFNNIYSNLYNVYYIVLLVLSILGIVHNYLFHISVLLLLGFVFYFIRSFLEIEAMTKAKYVAKEYMQKEGSLEKEQIEEITDSYEQLNQKGIKLVCYQLFSRNFLSILLYIVFIGIRMLWY